MDGLEYSFNSVKEKVIGIINSTKDSFTGDGVLKTKTDWDFY
jgi:hypothetical protein